MLNWSLKEIDLPLKFSRENLLPKNGLPEDSNQEIMKNFIVELKSSQEVILGEVASSKRFGENPEIIKSKFKDFMEHYSQKIGSVNELMTFADSIGLPTCLKAGVEMAFLNGLSFMSGRDVNELLGIDMVSMVQTSFSLPVMDVGSIAGFIENNNLNRFSVLKVKVESESALDSVNEVLKHFKGKIRIDGNETWINPEDVIKFLKRIKNSKLVEFLEQPLPFDHHDEYLFLKDNVEVDLIADESLVTGEVTTYYRDRFHGVKIKLMKSGGCLNALQQAAMARSLGLKTVLGSRIETSVGIATAMSIASNFDYLDLDGLLYLKKDPYNLVFEENGKLFLSYLQ